MNLEAELRAAVSCIASLDYGAQDVANAGTTA